MTQLIKVVYVKDGATFANGDAAKDDKNSLYSPELQQSVTDSMNALLAAGILIEPYVYTWDQETFSLTVNKLVTAAADYYDNITYDQDAVLAAAEEAGWTWSGTTVEDVTS